MLKSKWARMAGVGLLGLSLPVLAAVNHATGHSKTAALTRKNTVNHATTVAHQSTAIKPTALKPAVKHTTAKPKVVARKHVTTAKKSAARKSQPLHTTKKATRPAPMTAKKHPAISKKSLGNKLSTKPALKK